MHEKNGREKRDMYENKDMNKSNRLGLEIRLPTKLEKWHGQAGLRQSQEAYFSPQHKLE